MTLTAKSLSKNLATEEVLAAAKFLRSGAAYLEVRRLLNDYEVYSLGNEAQIKKKITALQIEMGYQKARAQSLEDLHKRFPSGSANSQQVIDPKDSGAKYMPIATQIIAINNDINGSKESIFRLQKELEIISLIKAFLVQGSILQNQDFDGLTLINQLLVLEADVRSKLGGDDGNGHDFFNKLRADLIQIQVRFTGGLLANTPPTATKKGMLKVMTLSLFAAFFIMLIALLIEKIHTHNTSVGIK